MNITSTPKSESRSSEVTSVGIIGGGSIGIAWAVVFASAGISVRIFELDEERRLAAPNEAESRLVDLHTAGLLDEPTEAILARISTWDTLEDAIAGVGYVQECIVEQLEAKRELFLELDRLTARDVVLASSTSTIMSSEFATSLPGRDRCLVVHPANPPYFLRIAEIVPAEFTSALTIEKTQVLLNQAQIRPILLRYEIEGFAFNRLQGALLREAYCLVNDGVISAVDLDTLVREGLGRRWSIIGPFTTSELNTRGGLRRHAEILGPVYARLGLERGSENPWNQETIDEVARDIQQQLPYSTWEENVRERDRTMIQFSSLMREFSNPLATQPAAEAARPAHIDQPQKAGQSAPSL